MFYGYFLLFLRHSFSGASIQAFFVYLVIHGNSPLFTFLLQTAIAFICSLIAGGKQAIQNAVFTIQASRKNTFYFFSYNVRKLSYCDINQLKNMIFYSKYTLHKSWRCTTYCKYIIYIKLCISAVSAILGYFTRLTFFISQS